MDELAGTLIWNALKNFVDESKMTDLVNELAQISEEESLRNLGFRNAIQALTLVHLENI